MGNMVVAEMRATSVDVDSLTPVVPTARTAHDVGNFGGAATRADASRRSGERPGRGALLAALHLRLLLLRDGHRSQIPSLGSRERLALRLLVLKLCLLKYGPSRVARGPAMTAVDVVAIDAAFRAEAHAAGAAERRER
jgi:hypothetical protein